MSKYGELSRSQGHSKWFLQKTLKEHDQTMDHPWMKMIYNQSFSIKQYCAWLALEHATFQKLEEYLDRPLIKRVHTKSLARTQALEEDLKQLLGAESWRSELEKIVRESQATQAYLAHLEEDASDEKLLLAHHFLQYNAVLSGGTYLGKMVSEKLAVPHGAPGVKFYAFDDIAAGKESARVQQYLRALDEIDISESDRDTMLIAMQRVYADTELMMKEIYEIQPANGIDYDTAKADAGKKSDPPPPIPSSELLELTLEELHGFVGADGGRILLSIKRELLDVSAGREIYGPGGGYSLFAGREVSRCLGTMSLEPDGLDDLRWEPDNAEEEQTLNNWQEKLKEKYPVAGRLVKSDAAISEDGTRKRQTPALQALLAKGAAIEAAGLKPEPSKASKPAEATDSQKCPISGKEGAGCPMAMFGIGTGAKSEGAAATTSSSAPAGSNSSGFMGGKSLVASVEKTTAKEESLLYALCPIHWDGQTIKVILAVAVCSWLSGLFVGWKLKGYFTA
eukprot:TRINITY_DN13990_c0_g1_i1.p1 TRINITY_DN13990_c0_g1~~TRINITY_DN13990_c0_g1_i1.p1  ORF type:complete len:525 (-),score=102.31 TRINITY_DN13990_c0_g1_i1:202-1725(-)